MKTHFILIMLAIVFMLGCTPKEKVRNPETFKNEITQLLHQYLEAWNAKDIQTLDKMTSDKGMYFGSDPDEIMDKTALLAMYREFFTDTTGDYRYEIDKQNIIPATDGKSVMAVEYIIFKKWSPNIPLRQSFQFIYENNSWKINFIAWGFIVKNEDVEILNKVLE